MSETYVRAVFEDATGDERSVEIRYDTEDSIMPTAEYVRHVFELVPDTAIVKYVKIDGSRVYRGQS